MSMSNKCIPCGFISGATVFLSKLTQAALMAWVSIVSAFASIIEGIGYQCASNVYVVSEDIIKSQFWDCKDTKTSVGIHRRVSENLEVLSDS